MMFYLSKILHIAETSLKTIYAGIVQSGFNGRFGSIKNMTNEIKLPTERVMQMTSVLRYYKKNKVE